MSFQGGDTKLERDLPKNQHTQRKLVNFEDWCNGVVSKSVKIWLSTTIFYDNNHQNVSQFFFHWRSKFFVIDIFLITSIFRSLYFLKRCPIFDSSPLHHEIPIISFGYVFGKNHSNFVSPTWKLNNPYCHTLYYRVSHIETSETKWFRGLEKSRFFWIMVSSALMSM